MVADGFLSTAPVADGTRRRPSDRDRYQVFVHLDRDPLAPDHTLGATLDDGTQVSAETFRRICCDTSLVAATMDAGGRPLDVGRRTRTIPAAIWRGLYLRDRGCRFPGCWNTMFLQGHHIHHWLHGGETAIDNLVLLCSAHHRLLHEGRFAVEMSDDAVKFRDSRGRAIPDVPPPAASGSDGTEAAQDWFEAHGLHRTPDGGQGCWADPHPQYDHIVDCLLSAA